MPGAEASPHQRVRAALLLSLVLMAMLALVQWGQARALGQAQLADVRVIQLAQAQAVLSEELGRAALQAWPGSPSPSAIAALRRALETAHTQGQALDSSLASQPVLSPAWQATQGAAAARWHAASDRLARLAQALIAELERPPVPGAAAAPARAAALSVASTLLDQAVAPTTDAAAQLARNAAELAHARNQQGQARQRDGALGVLALLLVLALAVGEPAARAVQRQHRQLSRLAQVAERNRNPKVATDLQGRIDWANEAFCALCNQPLTALVGTPVGRALSRLLLDDSARLGVPAGLDIEPGPQVLARLAAAIADRQAALAELHCRRTDGTPCCLAVDLQPVRDDAGLVTGFFIAFVDETERVTERLHTAALLGALPNGVMLRNASGHVLDCNPAALAQLHLSRAQLLGDEPFDPAWQALHADGRPMARDEWPAVQALRSGRSLHGQAMGVMAPGGALRWLLVNAELIHDAGGRVAGTATCFTDVTEQRKQQAVLAHTVDAAGLGTWQWDMDSGEMRFNDRLQTMLGWRPGDLAPTIASWSALVHPDDRALWQAALRDHLANPALPCRAELRVRRPDGDWAAVLSCGVVIERAANGAARRMAGINIDMTEQHQMQAMLRHAARTDGLTQLPNRAAVFDHVQQVLDRAQREPGFGYAVLFMDFDRFKQVNDTLGHGAGDELLRQIAQRLRAALRAGDGLQQRALHVPQADAAASTRQTAGRIGGDEFVVVLEGVRDRADACAVARRLMDVLAQPYEIAGQLVHSSASVGIVTSEQAANDARVVMRDADTAMYEAKRAGRDRYVVFDPSMHERVAHSVETERDLRAALERGELFVVYQPVVEMQRSGPGGVEALVRWQHPVRGLVPPIEFIGVAEESGLIVELGRFVLQTACRQFTAWQQALGPLAPTSMAVNLSPMQLRSAGLVAEVAHCLRDSGIAPAALQLEVTESLAAQDDAARAKLRALKALGVRIALDDFGTGYSSLACLHQLPVDTVKIDRSFVMHADSSDYHRVLIEATIRVARTLGMGTVAEGIETPAQAALMHKLRCDRGQGYLFSKPLTAPALQAWLTDRGDLRQVIAAA